MPLIYTKLSISLFIFIFIFYDNTYYTNCIKAIKYWIEPKWRPVQLWEISTMYKNQTEYYNFLYIIEKSQPCIKLNMLFNYWYRLSIWGSKIMRSSNNLLIIIFTCIQNVNKWIHNLYEITHLLPSLSPISLWRCNFFMSSSYDLGLMLYL